MADSESSECKPSRGHKMRAKKEYALLGFYGAFEELDSDLCVEVNYNGCSIHND